MNERMNFLLPGKYLWIESNKNAVASGVLWGIDRPLP